MTVVKKQIVVDRNVIRRRGLDAYKNQNNIEFIITDTFLVEMVKNAHHWPDTVKNDLGYIEPYLGSVRLAISVGEVLRIEQTQKRALLPKDIINEELDQILMEIRRAARIGSNHYPALIQKISAVIPSLRDEGSIRNSASLDIRSFTDNLKSAFGKNLVSDLRKKTLTRNSKLSYVLMASLLAYRAQLESNNDMVPLPLHSMSFRFMVLNFWRSIRWIKDGGLESSKDADLANDEFDNEYILIGSYFSETLSNEKSVIQADEDLRKILKLVRTQS